MENENRGGSVQHWGGMFHGGMDVGCEPLEVGQY